MTNCPHCVDGVVDLLFTTRPCEYCNPPGGVLMTASVTMDGPEHEDGPEFEGYRERAAISDSEIFVDTLEWDGSRLAHDFGFQIHYSMNIPIIFEREPYLNTYQPSKGIFWSMSQMVQVLSFYRPMFFRYECRESGIQPPEGRIEGRLFCDTLSEPMDICLSCHGYTGEQLQEMLEYACFLGSPYYKQATEIPKILHREILERERGYTRPTGTMAMDHWQKDFEIIGCPDILPILSKEICNRNFRGCSKLPQGINQGRHCGVSRLISLDGVCFEFAIDLNHDRMELQYGFRYLRL